MSISDVERLLEEREIIDLTIRYTWAIDHGHFEDLGTIFAPDGTADYGRLGIFQGPEAIGRAISGALAGFDRTQHLVTNHQVTVDGDQARGRCYFQAQHVTRGAAGDDNYIIAGQYLDQFRRTEQGWRIASRVLRVTWRDGNAPGTATARSAALLDGGETEEPR